MDTKVIRIPPPQGIVTEAECLGLSILMRQRGNRPHFPTGGASPPELRTHFHNLQERSDRARTSGLMLRKRTAEHLVKMIEEGEYLVSCCGPERATTLSQFNRLLATFKEIAKKVRQKVCPQEAAQSKIGDSLTVLVETSSHFV